MTDVSKTGMTVTEQIQCLMNLSEHRFQWNLGLDAAAIESDFHHIASLVGQAADKSRTEAEKRNEMLLLLIAALYSGELSKSIRKVFIRFLTDVYNSDDEPLTRKILGLPPISRGRPFTDEVVRGDRASSVYEYLIEEGHSDHDAVHGAWQEYHLDKVAAVEQRKQGKRSGQSPAETRYEAQMRAVRARLNKDVGRKPAKAGRKKILKPK